MLRRSKHGGSGSNFNDTACVKHKDAIRKAGEQRRVVGNQDHCHAELSPEAPKNLEDFLLRRGVERSRWFIGNDEGRSAGNGLRDENALTLATAQFMRIGARDSLGIA